MKYEESAQEDMGDVASGNEIGGRDIEYWANGRLCKAMNVDEQRMAVDRQMIWYIAANSIALVPRKVTIRKPTS